MTFLYLKSTNLIIGILKILVIDNSYITKLMGTMPVHNNYKISCIENQILDYSKIN